MPAIDLYCQADFTLKANTVSRALTDTSAPLSGGRTMAGSCTINQKMCRKKGLCNLLLLKAMESCKSGRLLVHRKPFAQGSWTCLIRQLAFSTWDDLMCFKIHLVHAQIKWKGPWIWISRASGRCGSCPVVFLQGHTVTLNHSWRWCCRMTEGSYWQSDHDIQTITSPMFPLDSCDNLA